MRNIIDKIRIDRRIRVGYGTAFVILLISYVITLTISTSVLEQTKRISQSNELITSLDIYLSKMKDAELGFKGYLLTGNTGRLEDFNRSRSGAGSYLYIVFPDTAQHNEYSSRLKKIKELTNQKFALIDSAVYAFRQNSYSADAVVLSFEEKEEKLADSLAKIIVEMQTIERNNLETRTKQLEAGNQLLNRTVIISLVLALLLFVFAFLTFARENKARQIADIRADEYSDELEKKVEDLNRLNMELKEMRRMEKFTTTGRVARTIAHEVRNPLTNINLAIEHLKTEPGLDDSTRNDFYEMVIRNSRRINELITSLLNATGFTELRTEKISINDLLEETLQLAEDRITLKGVTVVKHFSAVICAINIDREKMKIALLNIIVNAIEAMEQDNGVLTLTTFSKANKCVILMADNGKGMNEETANKLFEPYYSSKSGGTGLGLTNAANIILNHKGNIHVESKEGEGTCFEITIDLA